MEIIENRKKRLCFGTFFNVLYQCTTKKCNKTTFLETLLKTIDPKANVIGEKYRQYNHIYKCETNFSTLLSDGSLLFPNIDKDNVTQEFQKHVIPLIDIDKLTPLVLSICDIIKDDTTLSYENNGENVEKFQRYIGMDIGNFLNSKEYYLTNFLANIFLYTVVEINNQSGHEWIEEIKKDKNYKDYTEYFKNFVNENNSKKNAIIVHNTYMQTKQKPATNTESIYVPNNNRPKKYDSEISYFGGEMPEEYKICLFCKNWECDYHDALKGEQGVMRRCIFYDIKTLSTNIADCGNFSPDIHRIRNNELLKNIFKNRTSSIWRNT